MSCSSVRTLAPSSTFPPGGSTFYNMENSPEVVRKIDLHNDFAFYHYSTGTWENSAMVYNYVNEMMDDMHYQGALILDAGNAGMNEAGIKRTRDTYETREAKLASQGSGAAGSAAQTSSAAGGAAQAGSAPRAAAGGAAQAGAAQTDGAPGGGGPGGGSKSDDDLVAEAKEYEYKGYDVYSFNSSSLEAAKRIRNETDLILMGRYSVTGSNQNTPTQPTAAELDAVVARAKKLEGLIDILWIRVSDHPNSWNQDQGKPKSLAFAEAIKKAGINIITCPSAGFHDPVENDQFIASGKTDMVGMTTPFFADPELVRKLKEGRPDDVVPCIGCEDCHGPSMWERPWYSTCTVNPNFGMPPYQLKGITAAKKSKKVAVIGGGPAGMKAALVSAERGHKVTLYEKDAALGGLLKVAATNRWMWGNTGLKEYYIHQLKKAGVVVKVSTAATPEMMKAAKYDTVLVATGNDLVPSSVKTDGVSKVFTILDAYYKKNELGKNVVVIGSGKFAFDTAVCMVKDGHKVTMLLPGKKLIEYELVGPHSMRNAELIIEDNPDFVSVPEAKVTGISGGKVTYTDASGKQNSVQADSVVAYSGLRPRMDEAVKFIGSADEVLMLGDCTGTNGTLLKTTRSAFFVASQV